MASPFAVFRRHQKVLIAVLGLLAMISFVFLPILMDVWGLRGGGRVNPVMVTTKKYGKLTRQDVQLLLQDRHAILGLMETVMAQAYSALLPGMDVRRIIGPQLQNEFGQPTERNVVQTWLLARRAEEQGIVVSDEAVKKYIESRAMGKVPPEQLNQILRRSPGGPTRMIEALKHELMAKRLQDMFGLSINAATPAERWDYFRRLRQQATVELATVPVEDFVSKVPDPDEATVTRFFEEHKERLPHPASPDIGFRQPYRAALEYFKAEENKFVDPKEITDEEIRQYYEKNKDSLYRQTTLPSREESPGPTPEAAKPEAAKPEAAKSKPATPEMKVEPAKPETKPSTPTPETKKPEGKPEASKPAVKAESKPGAAKAESKSEKKSEARSATKTEAPSTTKAEKAKAAPKTEPKTAPKSDAKGGKDTRTKSDEDKSSQAGRRSIFRLASYTADAKTESKPESKTETKAAPKSDAKPQSKPESKTGAKTEAKPQPKSEAKAEAKPEPKAEKPAAKPQGPVTSEPVQVKYRPLEEVREQIRMTLARQRATTKMHAALEPIRDQMNNYNAAMAVYRQEKRTNKNLEPPAKPDLPALAKKQGVAYSRTDLISEWEARRLDIGSARLTGNNEPVLQYLYQGESRVFRPGVAQDPEGNLYLFWKAEEEREHVPQLADVKDQVVHAWKQLQARKLADDEAKRLAEKARQAKTSLREALRDQSKFKVSQPAPFSWLTTGSVPSQMSQAIPEVTPVEGVEMPGPEFMRTVFTTASGQVGTAMNNPKTFAYVIRVMQFNPTDNELWDQFLKEDYRAYQMAGYRDQQRMVIAWTTDLQIQAGLRWLQEPDRRLSEAERNEAADQPEPEQPRIPVEF